MYIQNYAHALTHHIPHLFMSAHSIGWFDTLKYLLKSLASFFSNHSDEK